MGPAAPCSTLQTISCKQSPATNPLQKQPTKSPQKNISKIFKKCEPF